jgi:hypothetical protein
LITLTKGRTVTVEKVIGPWALITLDSGRQGYVKAVFLELPARLEVVAAPTLALVLTPAPIPPTPMPTDTAASTPALAPEAHADAARRDVLAREVAQLRDRLAALESAVVTTPGGATPAGRTSAEAAPSAEVTPSDEAPLSERPPTLAAAPLLPSIPQPPEAQEIGPSLALAGVGLIIGFLLGAAYGRRQERNRRSRVRF